jgi:hypothetical protein
MQLRRVAYGNLPTVKAVSSSSAAPEWFFTSQLFRFSLTLVFGTSLWLPIVGGSITICGALVALAVASL